MEQGKEVMMIVTAWNSGQHSKAGGGYGLKISIRDRDKYFNRKWTDVELELSDSDILISVNIAKSSFWGDICRELIHKEIGKWLISRNLAPWKPYHPPKLKLEPIKGSRFRLKV